MYVLEEICFLHAYGKGNKSLSNEVPTIAVDIEPFSEGKGSLCVSVYNESDIDGMPDEARSCKWI